MKVKQLSLDVSTGRLVAILGNDIGERMQIDYVCPAKSDSLHRLLYDAREAGNTVDLNLVVLPSPPVEEPKPKGKKKIVDMGGTAACTGGIK
jgi:hypothetical protein